MKGRVDLGDDYQNGLPGCRQSPIQVVTSW